MKKIITLVATAAMLAVSCQKEAPATDNTGNTSSSNTDSKLTATIVKTKVTYTETAGMDLQPAWEVGDKIIGFDDAGNTYTLTVASVSAETATLSGTVPDGTMHLIYKSGAKASDISNKTLAIDYTAQKGDKTMPAVMLADGTVEDGACEFAFTNAGAIIGISALYTAWGFSQGSTISKISVEGENLSAATVTLDGSALKLTATEKADDAISIDGLNLTTTDAKGTLSAPIFIAVPAGAVITGVSASVTKEPETMTIPSTAADKKDIDYVEIEAKYDGTNLSTKKWAKWNVGANSQSEYGWYFAWGGTEGYIIYSHTAQLNNATSFQYSHPLDAARTAGAGDYLYVNGEQSFSTFDHEFIWANAPFNNGSYRFDETYFNSVKSTVWPDNTLAIDYDAAHVNWGGSWRMPTNTEFKALESATYWAWDSTDGGCYVFSADASHTAGTYVSSIPNDLTKSNALLFFPAAGGICHESHHSFYKIGTKGYYWSTDLTPFLHYDAYLLDFDADRVMNNGAFICDGYPIRAISD